MDMMTIATVALAALTAVLAAYTRNLFIEARKTREHQTNPNVIITAVHDEDRPTIIRLLIRNIGDGLALDIKFNPSKEIKLCFGLDVDSPDIAPITDGPLIHGIPSLGPGETRTIDWGQPGGLLHELQHDHITILIEYLNSSKKRLHQECKIDIASFLGTVANPSNQTRTVVALENISKTLQSMHNTHKP